MVEENNNDVEKTSKKLKLPTIVLTVVALVGVTGCIVAKRISNISSSNINITIEDLTEGSFNKKKALKDYSRIVNGELPKYAVVDEEKTIEGLCQLYEDNVFVGFGDLKSLICFKGDDYEIKISLEDEFSCFNPSFNSSHRASIEFRDSTGIVIDELSGSFEYKSDNDIRELSQQYKTHPKVLEVTEQE